MEIHKLHETFRHFPETNDLELIATKMLFYSNTY